LMGGTAPAGIVAVSRSGAAAVGAGFTAGAGLFMGQRSDDFTLV